MRALQSKPNIIAPTVDFPFGQIKDDSGNNDGVPVDEQVYGDFHQFFEKLMSDGGVTANGLPDNETNSFQLNEALHNIAVVPALSYLGTFADIIEFNADYTSPDVIEAFDADADNVFIGKVNAGNRSIDKLNIKTQVGTGFAFLGTDNIGEVSVDETHVWVFTDGFAKKVRAFDKLTGTEDLTKAFTLPTNVYGAFVAPNNSPYWYVADNTNNLIRGYAKVNAAPLPTWAFVSDIVDIDVNNGRLYTVTNLNSTCYVYEAILGTQIDTFQVTAVPATNIKSIEVFAGRIYILKGDLANNTIPVFSADTFLQLHSQERALGGVGGGVQNIKVAANYRYVNHAASTNRIDAHKQEFRF